MKTFQTKKLKGKIIMKKALSLILAIALVFGFASCGGGNSYTPGDKIRAFSTDISAKNKNFFYSANVTSSEETIQVYIALKDNKYIVSMSDPTSGLTYKILCDGNGTYLVSDDEKTALKYGEAEDVSTFFDVDDLDFAEALDDEANEYTIDSGSEEYNGKKYDFEKVTEGDDVTTFYFDTNSSKLVYAISGDTIIEYLEYGSNPAENLFTIPTDYTIL